jgi:transketolase C-terminal domain/subunit
MIVTIGRHTIHEGIGNRRVANVVSFAILLPDWPVSIAATVKEECA